VIDVLNAATSVQCPVFVLGNGSNLLISDHGVRGLVIQLAGGLADASADGSVLTVGAGLKLVVLLATARAAGWPGLECLAGIPGTVGGAVRMNAGTSLGEIQEILVDVQMALPDGRTVVSTAEELRMSYRTCHLPPGAVVLKARLRSEGDLPTTLSRIKIHLDHRKRSQPLDLPSGGSTFRNPAGDWAGRLIEAAGLKGHRIGSAQVSERHANFIVNLGDAKAGHVRALIETVQRRVWESSGVRLQREVHYAGDWSQWAAGREAGAAQG